MEIEDVLEPGERLLWEGRPSGTPTRFRQTLMVYAVLVVGLAALTAWVLDADTRGYATRSFQLGIGTIEATGSTTTPSSSGATELPNPLSIVLLFAAFELWHIATWRARRYAITDRRAFAVDEKGRRLGSIARESVERVSVEGRSVVIEGPERQVRFEGLDDPEAARTALEQAPLRPPAPEEA